MKRQIQHRGKASDSKSGRKPCVAHALEDLAKKNIEAKLALVVDAIKAAQSGGGAADSEMPTSRTQFNKWAPSDPAGVALLRNANDTLKRHPSLLSSVDEAVATLKEMLRTRDRAVNQDSKQERLASARRAQRIHWNLRVIAERALITARRELQDARDQLRLSESAARSAGAEYQRKLQRLTEENDGLRTENARLTRAYSTVVPLRGR